MRMRKYKIGPAMFVLLALGLQYCAPTKPTASKVLQIDEDLSYLRVDAKDENIQSAFDEKERVWALEPKYDLRDEMDSVLSIVRTTRSEIKFLNGYTVLVYSGNNRELANEARIKVYDMYKTYEPEITYVQPNFKVSVGKFFDRLEANRVFIDLKPQFPGAIVLPEKIYFK